MVRQETPSGVVEADYTLAHTRTVTSSASTARTGAIDEKLSDYPLVQDAILTPAVLEIAVDAIFWERHQRMSPREFARELLRMARYVKLSRDPKSKRGSKEPQPRKKSRERNRHISAARLLAEAGAK
ncbi:hypothetical protein [Planctellipticum variicoloris]|uniref:hypothetical protein n=1 Tax=Planctellipticum variicoloris TaxID=3064265 RepID=UPI0030137940|nr:hypothetical protein SH412_002694 [Planctomycetaceae bacterium SH412]